MILGDRVEAEDAVHDAAVAAWRGFAELRDPDRFHAWFRRILVNCCRDRLRARARHRITDVGREPVESEHPLVKDASERAAVRDALARALDTLKPDEQTVVALRFHADLTVPAIVDGLGIRRAREVAAPQRDRAAPCRPRGDGSMIQPDDVRLERELRRVLDQRDGPGLPRASRPGGPHPGRDGGTRSEPSVVGAGRAGGAGRARGRRRRAGRDGAPGRAGRSRGGRRSNRHAGPDVRPTDGWPGAGWAPKFRPGG